MCAPNSCTHATHRNGGWHPGRGGGSNGLELSIWNNSIGLSWTFCCHAFSEVHHFPCRFDGPTPAQPPYNVPAYTYLHMIKQKQTKAKWLVANSLESSSRTSGEAEQDQKVWLMQYNVCLYVFRMCLCVVASLRVESEKKVEASMEIENIPNDRGPSRATCPVHPKWSITIARWQKRRRTRRLSCADSSPHNNSTTGKSQYGNSGSKIDWASGMCECVRVCGWHLKTIPMKDGLCLRVFDSN